MGVLVGVLSIGGRRCHLSVYRPCPQSVSAVDRPVRRERDGITMEFTPIDAVVALKTDMANSDLRTSASSQDAEFKELYVEKPLPLLKVVVLEPDDVSAAGTLPPRLNL